jgi:hypothetical protein
VRESWFGENEGGRLRPQWAWGVGAESRASQPGRAARLFLIEVDTAQTRGPG